MVYPHTYRTEHSETHTTNAVYGEYYEAMQSKKIRIQPKLLTILQYVDANRANFVKDLEEAIKIKSVSGHPKYKDNVNDMIKFTEEWLAKLDIKFESFNIGYYQLDGKRTRLPPIILCSVGNDPRKRTVCVYIHLDVPDPKGKKWDTDPWTLVQKDNKMYGNGVGCGKAILMIWLHVIQAFKSSNLHFPVNLKFIMESMNHQNSEGLGQFIASRSQDFFANVELIVECESEWLGEKIPCVIYGTVGILDFQMTIEKTENSKADLREEIIKICDTFTDNQGKIVCKGFNDFVEQITPDEEKVYEDIQDFDPEEVRNSLPDYKKSWDKVKLLMSFWRLPSIYFDEIEECICEKNDKSILKRNFLVKIVPKQVVNPTDKIIRQHVSQNVKKLKIENKVSCKMISSTRTWFENYSSPSYVAARKAFLQIYKEDPNLIREDRARETVTIFDNVLEKSVLVLPLCPKGANLGEANENIPLRNYYEGTKLIAAFLYQYAGVRAEN